MLRFLAVFLICSHASALVLDRLPFKHGGATVYEWRGSICEHDTLPNVRSTNVELHVYTSGGYVTHLDDLKQQIDGLAHGRSLTVVFGECGSACVRLLAHVNKLARAGILRLQVERGETVGFHGVSVGGTYDADGTQASLQDMIREGMNARWLSAHSSYFELYASTIQTVAYEDPDLSGAGLIDAAEIIDASDYHSRRSSVEPTSSYNTASGECPKESGELF